MSNTNVDYFRPELHITAERGVLEAPAGVLRDGQRWHVFYQYLPELSSSSSGNPPSRWGHVYSEDTPFDWELCDDVLAPGDGLEQLRAGAVVVDGEDLLLYYTAVSGKKACVQAARIPEVEELCPLSEDEGHVDERVQLLGTVVDDHAGFERFRSPCVVPKLENEPGWLMLTVTGPSGKPTAVVLDSQDGMNWQILGPLSFAGETGFDAADLTVGPRIVRLRDEVDAQLYDCLLLTIETAHRDISGYLVGHLKENTFTVKTPFTRIDYGHDFTRPRVSNTARRPHDDSQTTIFGLLNGIGRHDDPATHLSMQRYGWANALSLPRVVTLQDGILFHTPPSGVLAAVSSTQRALLWTGLCEVTDGAIIATVYDGSGHAAVRISHTGDELIVDRSMNPHHAGDRPARAPLMEADSDSLSILVDGSTLEVFADGGAISMSSRVYCEGGCARIEVETTGQASILGENLLRGNAI